MAEWLSEHVAAPRDVNASYFQPSVVFARDVQVLGVEVRAALSRCGVTRYVMLHLLAPSAWDRSPQSCKAWCGCFKAENLPYVHWFCRSIQVVGVMASGVL